MDKINIYKRIQDSRCQLQQVSFKKSGKNKHLGYEYFELGDFLPTINDIMQKNGLSSFVNFGAEEATLTIVNVDNPDERIVFTSPVADAGLRGSTPIQGLGAIQTYLRRYLYMNAFEIVENDILDATQGKPNPRVTDDKDKVDYKKSIGNMLVEMYGKENAPKELEKLTAFKGSDGQEVAGVSSLDKLSDKRAQATYGKVKKLYELTQQAGA